MKKTVLVLILDIILLAAIGSEAKAQAPKEVTTSFTSSYSGTSKILAMGQERVQLAYEFMGAIVGDTPEDFSHNSSFRCIGTWHAVNGEYNDGSTFCVVTRPDGDQIFTTYKTAGNPGRGYKGTYTVVGGTGKMVGIQGSGECTGFDLRPSAQGTFQGYSKQRGQYKLP